MQVAHRKWARVIMRHTEEDEPLVWSGRPRRGLVLRGRDALAIPVSLAVTAGAVFAGLELHARFGVDPMPTVQRAIVLWAPLAALGLIAAYYLLGRFVVDAFRRRSTIYGLTPQRLIVVSGMLGDHVESFGLLALPEADLRLIEQRADGHGTVRLRRPGFFGWLFHEWRAGTGLWFPPLAGTAAPRLDQVEDAAKVLEGLRKLRAKEAARHERRAQRKKCRPVGVG